MAVRFLNILNLTGLKSIFITLAHSLWLGTVMALLAGIIIILTNRSASSLRYKLLTGLLILFTAGIAYIFYTAFTDTETLPAANVTMVSDQANIQQTQNIQQQKPVLDALLSFIDTHADTIVSIWFIVVCFKCIRLISGLRALHKLKKTNILEAGTYWIERMNELAAKIGIVNRVLLLQSSLAKIPMVIGHLKPVILFPIGILNALPPDEVEAILLHELAHIRRNDFLINLLQQFAEIFFFFNPGVLWVSSLIKNERENCCDDIAIAVTHNKKIFIHALVAFQEYNAGLTYATTFPGPKNHLLNRVKRIITNNNKTLNNMEKLILASGIIITSLVALAFSPGHIKAKKEAIKTGQAIASISVAAAPTQTKFRNNSTAALPKYEFSKNKLSQKIATDTIRYSGVIDGKKIELTEENGHLKELYVDGKKIPEDQYDRYHTIIDKVHHDMKVNTAKLKMDSDELEEIQQQMEVLKETEEMKGQKSNPMPQDSSIQEDLIKRIETMKEAEEMKEQGEHMKQDFSKQQEMMKQQRVTMQKEMKLMSKKNEEMSKAQSLKMQADLIKQQKQLGQKQAEFQKQIEKMKLQQEKFNEMMRDSIRAKRITRVKPAVYSGAQIFAKPAAIAKSEILLNPGISFKSATPIRPAIAISLRSISSVNVEPVTAVTSVFTISPQFTLLPIQ